MPSKRGKQGLNRAQKPNVENQPESTPHHDYLLKGAEEFFAAGMRYPLEIPIHEEMQSQGIYIPYLTEAERVDVNPLLIRYHRANTLRQHEGLPLLEPQGDMPIFERGTAESPLDPLPENLMQDLTLAVPQNARRVRSKDANREIEINGIVVKFTNSDVEWPAGKVNYSTRVSQLFRDWDDSAIVTLKGVPVPLKYWGQLYNRVNTGSWGTFKKDYGQFKTLVGVFSSEYQSDKNLFWERFSKLDPSTGEKHHLHWTDLCLETQKTRERIDSEDMAAAQAKYDGNNGNPTFNTFFRYRKGSSWRVMSTRADIARKYREAEKTPRPWDDVYKH